METYQFNSLEKKIHETILRELDMAADEGYYNEMYIDSIAEDCLINVELSDLELNNCEINSKEMVEFFYSHLKERILANVKNNMPYLKETMKELVEGIQDTWKETRRELLEEDEEEVEPTPEQRRAMLEQQFINSLSPAQKRMHQELSKSK